MRRGAWIGVGLIASVVIVGAAFIVPVAGLGLPTALAPVKAASSPTTPEPVWNTGNLCTAVFNDPNPGDVQCVSDISNSKAPLWYNFSSPGKVKGGVVNVTILGSHDCIFLNFHSIDTTLNITILGSGYACAYASNGTITGSPAGYLVESGISDWGGGGQGCSGWGGNWLTTDWSHGGNSTCCGQGSGWGGGGFSTEWGHGSGGNVTCGPGVNIAVVSEDDVMNLVQGGSSSPCHHGSGGYATNVTVYAATTVVNVVQNSDKLNTTVTYIGSKAGFSTCPYRYEYGRVHWTEVANGNKDTFNTIFVNQAGAKGSPVNSPYTTEPLGPPAGIATGYDDIYGNENTTTAPPGTCQYIVV